MAALGLMMTPLLTQALAVLPHALYSHGSAILTTLQQVAGAAGTAVFVTVAALGAANASGAPDEAGLRTAFMFAGVVGVLAVVAAFFVRPVPVAAAADEEPAAEASVSEHPAAENPAAEDPVGDAEQPTRARSDAAH